MHIRINGNGNLGRAIGKEFLKLKNDSFTFSVNKQNDDYDKYPDIIIHTSWQTNVDAWEDKHDESRFISFRPLEKAVEMSERYNSQIIFISTSYVFDGLLGTDQPGVDARYKSSWNIIRDPLSNYGLGKSDAEWQVHGARGRKCRTGSYKLNNIIVRTDAFYDNNKTYNYSLGAIDQISCPTYVPYCAKAIAKLALLDKDWTFRQHANDTGHVFNIAGQERMSRYEFIKRFSNPNVNPVTLAELDLPAKRPRNSSLQNDDFLTKELLGVDPISIEEAKAECWK